MKQMMLKFAVLAATVPIFVGGAAHAADTVTFNSTPSENWHYGSGNDYTPSNSAVLSTAAGDELALRMHQTFFPAPASDASGVYSFALGTDPMSFDWGIDTADTDFSALITLTNIGSGASVSYNPFFVGNDNSVLNNSAQNSFRLNWAGIGFDPNVNNTYKVNLTVNGLAGGTSSLDTFAKMGLGAAVPEPGVWAMMILGFGLVGGTMRRKRSETAPAFA